MPIPTRLILLRHGETSLPDRLHGAESDVALGDRGRDQAREATVWLRQLAPSALYCSAMRRAIETATLIGDELGLTPIVNEQLHERRMGSLSGMPRSLGLPEHQRIKDGWRAGDLESGGDTGESYIEIRDRARAALVPILQRHPGETIVVVCHGVLMQVLLSSMIKGFSHADFDRIGLGFVTRNELIWDGQAFEARYLNGEAVGDGLNNRVVAQNTGETR